MGKLIGIILFLILTLTIAGIGIRQFAQNQVDQKISRLQALFTDADGKICKPECLLGIRLNMDYEEAITLLRGHHPLLSNVTIDESGWIHVQGRSTLTGIQLAIHFDLVSDKVTMIQVFDESKSEPVTPRFSFTEALFNFGNDLFVFGSLPSGQLFYFEDTHIWMVVNWDELSIEQLRQGQDITIAEISIGNKRTWVGTRWCGLRICKYDPSFYKN